MQEVLIFVCWLIRTHIAENSAVVLHGNHEQIKTLSHNDICHAHVLQSASDQRLAHSVV